MQGTWGVKVSANLILIGQDQERFEKQGEYEWKFV